jgi:hypothetical protein
LTYIKLFAAWVTPALEKVGAGGTAPNLPLLTIVKPKPA